MDATNDAADQDDSTPPVQRAESRARHLLPEERSTGSEDPQAQAQAILAESEQRESDPQAAPDTFLERRTSAQTVDPADVRAAAGEPPD